LALDEDSLQHIFSGIMGENYNQNYERK